MVWYGTSNSTGTVYGIYICVFCMYACICVCAHHSLLIMCARMYVSAGWLVDIYLCVCCSSNLQSLLKFIRLSFDCQFFSFYSKSNRKFSNQFNRFLCADCQKKQRLEAAQQCTATTNKMVSATHRRAADNVHVCVVSVKYNCFSPDFTWNTANRRWFLWPFGNSTQNIRFASMKKSFCCCCWCFWCWCCLTNSFSPHKNTRSFVRWLARTHTYIHKSLDSKEIHSFKFVADREKNTSHIVCIWHGYSIWDDSIFE